MIKQDPEAETVYIIWYAREPYHYEATSDRLRDDGTFEPVWEYMAYFDKEDYEADLEYIADKYKAYKVRIYKLSEQFNCDQLKLIK
jgi:hypothetical protein